MKWAIVLVMTLLVSDCATLSKITTPAAQPYIQAAVDVAVATFIGTNPPEQKPRAIQIKAIAQEVLALDEGSVLPITQIEGFVNSKIAALRLPPADVAAAQLLMAAITTTVQVEIQNLSTHGNVTNNTQAAVAQILTDVITATAAYGA